MPEIDAILAYHVWLAESQTRKMAISTAGRSDSDHKLRRVPRPLAAGAAILLPRILGNEGRGTRRNQERRMPVHQAKDWKKTKQYRELKSSMLDNLEARGLLEKAYTDKVEEYLDFWCRRQELQADVAERGLTVEDDRGRITENRSVSLEVQVARQMLAVWTALGFKDAAAKSDTPGGGDDEL